MKKQELDLVRRVLFCDSKRDDRRADQPRERNRWRSSTAPRSRTPRWRESLGQNLAKLEEQIYELKKTKLESLIDETLIAGEAKKRGLSQEALIKAEVTAKLKPVTDEEIAVFYGANQARLQKDLSWLAG